MEAFTIASGVAVRYSDFGKGTQAILLLHGYGESIEVWEPLAGVLGKEFRVIRLDLPGSGFSDWGGREVIDMEFMATVTDGLLDKLGVDRCTVVGHSMGGYAAVAMAELFHERVEKLVLFHSSPSGDTPEKRENRAREIQLIEDGKKEILASINPARGFAPQNVKKCSEAIDELSEQIMLTDDRGVIATLRGMAARQDRCDFFANTSIPTMMIFGHYDNYIPMEAAQGMVSKYPKARIEWLENSGHMGLVEQVDLSATILTTFIRG